MTPTALTVRPAFRDDMSGVADLLNRLYGGTRCAEDLLLKWGGPGGRLCGSSVLTAGGRIVGALGYIPLRIRVAGREFPAAQGVDLAIEPGCRRLDAYLGLIDSAVRDLASNGIRLVYAAANGDATSAAESLFGRDRLAPVPLMVRPLRSDSSALGRGTRLLAGVLAVMDRCRPLPTGPVAGASRFRLKRAERFDWEFDFFWRKIQDDYPVSVVRDTAYLRWRYGGREGAYETLVLQEPKIGWIAGYIILTLRRNGRSLRGSIVDLVTSRHHSSALAGPLIEAALARFREQGAEAVEAWAFPRTHLRIPLLRKGFIPRRTGRGGFHVSVTATGAETGAAEKPSLWRLAMGDSDMV